MSEMLSRESGKRIVLDTNIFISGIFWKGDSNKILQLWRDGKIHLVSSLETLDELYSVIKI
jgi:putative PIN family toxin of toxin-antitoxin system